MDKNFDWSDLGSFLIVSAVLFFLAGMVIYTNFYILVSGRIQEYGQFRTVGMTQRQIQKMVFREGKLLTLSGIVFGLPTGELIGFLLVPDGWNPRNALIIAAIICIITYASVLLSISVPAKMAARVPPVEAARYRAYQGKTSPLRTRRGLLSPHRLAFLSIRRDKKKYSLIVGSLAFCGALLICGGTLTASFDPETGARKNFPSGEYKLSLTSGDNLLSGARNDLWASSRLKLKNPLNQSLEQKILSIDGVTGLQKETDMEIEYILPNGYKDNDKITGLSPQDAAARKKDISAGSLDYKTLVRQNGIAVSKDPEYWGGYVPKLGDKIQIRFLKSDGTVGARTFSVMALLSHSSRTVLTIPVDTMNSLSGLNCTSGFYVSVDPAKAELAASELRKIADSSEFLALGSFQDAIRSAESEIRSSSAGFYILGVVVALFGFINLLNTTLLNFVTRQREIGTLQAAGLDGKQLRKMLRMEGIFITIAVSVPAILAGAASGALFCYLYTSIWKIASLHYRFPFLQAAGFVLAMLLIQLLISSVMVRALKKKPLIERIREKE